MKKKSKYPHLECALSIIPSIDNFITHKWWTIFEATCVLAGWPKYEIASTTISPKCVLPDDLNEDRSNFMLPMYSEGAFNPKTYGRKFDKVFSLLKYKCENDPDFGKQVHIDFGINYVIHPIDVILFALEQNMVISPGLQKILSIKQMEQKQQKPWQKNIHNMIVAQFYALKYPNATLQEISKKGCWAQQYFKHPSLLNKKAITETQLRFQLKSILTEGKPGRMSSRKATRDTACKILILPIPEVMQKESGTFHCDFSLLATAVNSIAWLYFQQNNSNFKDFNDFFSQITNYPLLQLYSYEVPQIIQFYIEKCILKEYGKINSFCFYRDINNAFENSELKFNFNGKKLNS
jgi:hypothetical protein